MEGLIVLVLLVLIVFLVLPPIALAKANRALRNLEELNERLRELESRFAGGVAPVRTSTEMTEKTAAVTVSPMMSPPPLPVVPLKPREAEPAVIIPPSPAPSGASVPRPPINWEQFMGAKMFAWIGGFALFLGVAFFVKYSFEHNLIPPELRVAIGFLVGIALVIGGVMLKRKENVVTSHTLCATGILILYAVTFACRAFYHFSFFGLIPTFSLMTLITAAAFLLSIRLNALIVSILGIAGGFLTPVLLSTGQDNPFALFGYIALLDAGLLLVARRKEWVSLPILGAVGTVLMQMAWVANFFLVGKYFDGNKTLTPMAMFIGFAILFCAGAWATKRAGKFNSAISGAALGVGGFAMFWAFYFLSFSQIAHRPAVLFSYLFVIDVLLLALVFAKKHFARLVSAIGVVAFIWLAIWTQRNLNGQNLSIALAAYFIFAMLHSSVPLFMQRMGKSVTPLLANLFPAATLLLVLLPILKLATSSFLVWPLVFCVDVLALLAAISTGLLAAVMAVLVLTLVALGVWICQIPMELTGLSSGLLLIGGFAIFFVATAVWASHRLTKIVSGPPAGKIFGKFGDPANFAIQLPALSATLPFVLLILATLRLPLATPTPVFGLAFMLVVLLLGLTKLFSLDLLAWVALVSAVALEYAWHFAHFKPDHAVVALAWCLGFAALFTAFPFLFHRQFARTALVWGSAALATPLHFFLVYRVVRMVYPNGVLGLLPATFAIPSLLGLFAVLKRTPRDSVARTAQLALFGGAALFFITLIFPIQFDRQWITLGWALEGAALCWLFCRVPHGGLRVVGIGLLIVAFIRLAFNPAVLSYHERAATPILNWYLYTYGVVAMCLFFAALLLKPPRNLVLKTNAPALLYALGTVLVFLLLNIEIADYFTPARTSVLTLHFSGNFARDMSYSIAWALFALLLLIVGIRRRSAAVRYAGLALLAVVILKLFLHDLSQLDQLYRIAAFIVVAAIAIIASFLYQRFLGTPEKETAAQ